MNIEEIREYCISKTGVTESLPFNDTALVFKIMGKMFALLDLSEDERGISLNEPAAQNLCGVRPHIPGSVLPASLQPQDHRCDHRGI